MNALVHRRGLGPGDISRFFGQLPGLGQGDVSEVYAEACPGGDYMLVPATAASCGSDPEGNPLCTLWAQDGSEVARDDFACVSDCPLGYHRVLRYSGAYVDGQVRACLKRRVIDEIERAQPGTIRKLGPSAMQVASYAAIVAGVMVAVSLISKVGG